MVSNSELIELGEGDDDVSYVNEECNEEYILEDEATTSSTVLTRVELPPSPHSVKSSSVIKLIRSSSENLSSYIPSFQSSSSLRSSISPVSWSLDRSSSTDVYLQSSGGVIEGPLFPDFEPSSSEAEVAESVASVKEEKAKSIVEELPTKPVRRDSKRPKKKRKKGKCIKIPFLHEIIDELLSRIPLTNMQYIERLKVSIDPSKILSESTLHPTLELTIPEDNFAGTYTLNIQETNDGMLVESDSCFKDGAFTFGTRMFTKLTRDFLLVEENKTEFQRCCNQGEEKSLHVFLDINRFIAYRTTKNGKRVQKYRGCISLQSSKNFVLDGSIFALMRHLIAINYSGYFQCYTVTVAGRVCRQVFFVDEKTNMLINENVVEIIRLRKSTYDHKRNKKIEMSETYYLPTGTMVYHSWKYSPYIVHIEPFLLTHGEKLHPCMELTWKSDRILSSMFDFEKEYSECLLRNYLNSYPEVMELLNDYIISLFHQKPKSVIDYTCYFFEHF